jgi:adenosine deaminase
MQTTSSNLYTWLQRLPKIELHIHLEGAIPLDALWQLVQKYGGDPDVPNREAIERKFQYQDFPHFIETWMWKNQFLRQYEDFSFIAEAVGRDLAAQNIRYIEAFYSPPDFYPNGLKTQPLTEAIRQGLARVPEIEVALVADLVRNYGPEQGLRTLKEVNEVRDSGVIGIGIGGSEHTFPPEPYAEIYERARQMGFHTSAHAGEAAGPASIWGALRALKVDRIGHGTRAQEDINLLEYLKDHQIPIEMCPLSNLRTGVVASINQHPIRRYFENGLRVTVNSDDPKMFNNSLALEYQTLINTLEFKPEDIKTLITNGIQASWLPAQGKKRLFNEFTQDPAWLEAYPQS